MERREENIVIARNFHYRYEAFAPYFRWKTNSLSSVPWDDLPKNQQELMIATIEAIRNDGVIEFNQSSGFLDHISGDDNGATEADSPVD